MKLLTRLFMGSIFVAVMFAGANPTMAQEKAKSTKLEPTIKVLVENDKVRVTEVTFKPGAETASSARPARVIRFLTEGTLTRIYPDGRTEKFARKKDEVSFFDATPPYVVKNEGKTTIVLYNVSLK